MNYRFRQSFIFVFWLAFIANVTSSYGASESHIPFEKSGEERRSLTPYRELVTKHYTGRVTVSGIFSHDKQNPTGHEPNRLCFLPDKGFVKYSAQKG